MQYVAAVGTAGLYVAVIYPHQWGLKRYMQVLQMYENGEPLSVDADCKRIGQEVGTRIFALDLCIFFLKYVLLWHALKCIHMLCYNIFTLNK